LDMREVPATADPRLKRGNGLVSPLTCPGINKFVRPIPESLTCPRCQTTVEIWTDEKKTTCHSCGFTVTRDVQSCLDYCEYASKCKEIIEQKKPPT